MEGTCAPHQGMLGASRHDRKWGEKLGVGVEGTPSLQRSQMLSLPGPGTALRNSPCWEEMGGGEPWEGVGWVDV